MMPVPEFDKSLGLAIKKEDLEALLQVVRAAEKAIDCCPFCQRGLECKNVHRVLREALEALPEHLRGE